MLPAIRTNISNMINDLDHTFNEQWHSLLDNFFRKDSISALKSKFKNSSYPRLNAYVDNDAYCIEAGVPGIEPDDLTVEVFEEGSVREDNGKKKITRYLRIAGKKVSDETSDSKGYQVRELRSSQFERHVALPDNLESNDPQAEIKNGVLKLTWKVVKPIEKKPDVKKIEIKKG